MGSEGVGGHLGWFAREAEKMKPTGRVSWRDTQMARQGERSWAEHIHTYRVEGSWEADRSGAVGGDAAMDGNKRWSHTYGRSVLQ